MSEQHTAADTGRYPSAVMQTYKRFPLTIVKGKGSYVWDDRGTRYLDFTSGIAVCNLGHVPDVVKEQIEEQLATLWHCSNLYHIPVQEQLAKLLVEHSCGDEVFFCNSGAEANEAAIKLARRHAYRQKGADAFEIVTFRQSFHGRTMATLTATGQDKVKEGFFPLLAGFRFLPYNDFAALEEVVGERTIAVLLELVQGEGGVVPADPEWVNELARRCRHHDLLLMVDEIQTGMGRTGTLFAYEQYGIEPDVITLAKGLGSGFPIGAVLAKRQIAESFDSGSHGSTFGGNPLAATAGKATVEQLVDGGVLDQLGDKAAYLERHLAELSATFSEIKEVRGKGFLQGIVTDKAGQVIEEARKEKLLLLPAGADVVRILPPLTATYAEIDELIAVLQRVFTRLQTNE